MREQDILQVGARGFVGAHLLRHLRNAGFPVTGVARAGGGKGSAAILFLDRKG